MDDDVAATAAALRAKEIRAGELSMDDDIPPLMSKCSEQGNGISNASVIARNVEGGRDHRAGVDSVA